MAFPNLGLKKLHRVWLKEAGPALSIKQIRTRLAEEMGCAFTDEEWKEVKDDVKSWWMDQSPPGSPVKAPAAKNAKAAKKKSEPSIAISEEDEPSKKKGKPSQTKTTKYDRAANKNLKSFIGMIGGDDDDGEEEGEYDASDMDDFIASGDEGLLGEPDESDQDGSDDEEEEASASDSEAETPPPRKKKAAKKEETKAKPPKKETILKRKKSGASGDFKSAEIVDDSDDSSASITVVEVSSGDEGEGEKKAKPKREKPAKKARRSQAGSDVETAPKKKRKSSGPAPKEGDAEKGTDQEEDRIKKLKALVAAAGTTRAFNATTGAERTLSSDTRIKHLESLLKEAGLKCGSGVRGSLPSLAQAKKIGEKRELAREMEELSGAPVLTGLRTGKMLSRPIDEEEESEGEDEDEDEGKVKAPAKKFGAFLGDQSSDSD